mmetsp:Transcript_16360/g.34538  ORF Transcript_16360/g.34538 Transcript_16360/m.34538 type:complete len:568 (+) Transcript_16360:399-2102(+)
MESDSINIEVSLAQDAPQSSSLLQGRSLMVGNSPPSKRTGFEEDNVQYKKSRKSIAREERYEYDKNLLRRAVEDAGINAFGAVFVEVWALNEDGTKLQRPEGGHWMDPAFWRSLPDDELMEEASSLDRNAGDCSPGVGLAGTLFEESSASSGRVHWRQIKSLMDDPFVQAEAERRMERLYRIGLGLVATVPFSFQDQRGIVLYYSRKTAKIDRLRSKINERYLIGAADLIGASFAIHKSREEAAEMRRQMFREAVQKVKKDFKNNRSGLGPRLESLVLDREVLRKYKEEQARLEEEEQGTWGPPRVDKAIANLGRNVVSFGKWCLRRVDTSRKKWGGAHLLGPPRQSIGDCTFCFVGVFLAMLSLLRIATAVNGNDRTTFDFDGGWYSSSLCILFALTPAPVGQPRQIYLAHIWNILVGMALRQIPSGDFTFFFQFADAPPGAEYGLPLTWKQALAVAFGVSGQAFIGILHPPATGLSLAFASSDKWSWGTMLSVMAADTFMVVFAICYINLAEKIQYPLYWLGLGWRANDRMGKVQKSAQKSANNAIRRASSINNSSNKKGGDESV